MSSEKKIEFRIIGMELLSKEFTASPPEGVNLKFLFDIKAETRVREELNLVIPVVSIEVRGGKEEKEKYASITASCLFEIVNFKDHIKTNAAGLFEVPAILENDLRPLAISSVRGLLFAELRGTYLNNAILPILHFPATGEKTGTNHKLA